MLEGLIGYLAFTFIAAVVMGFYFILESLGEKAKNQAKDVQSKIKNTEIYIKKSTENTERKKLKEFEERRKFKQKSEEFEKERSEKKLNEKLKDLPEYIKFMNDYFAEIDAGQKFPTPLHARRIVKNFEDHLNELDIYAEYSKLVAELYEKCNFRVDRDWLPFDFHCWDLDTNFGLRQVVDSERESFLNNCTVNLMVNPKISLKKDKVVVEIKWMQTQHLKRETINQIFKFNTFNVIKNNDFFSHINSIRVW